MGNDTWRPDLYVIARILERLWRQDGSIVKTRLQGASGLNYTVFMRYLDWMRKKGWVASEEGSEWPEKLLLTPGGREAYKRLVQWLREIFGDIDF